MVLQLPQVFIVLRTVLQQRLTWLPLQCHEVAVEVSRKLNSLIVLKGLVQGGEDLVCCSGLLTLLKWETFKQLPCSAAQTAYQVEHCLLLPFLELHLSQVDVDPLSPFSVLRMKSTEQWYERISGAVAVKHGTPTSRGRRSHQTSSPSNSSPPKDSDHRNGLSKHCSPPSQRPQQTSSVWWWRGRGGSPRSQREPLGCRR